MNLKILYLAKSPCDHDTRAVLQSVGTLEERVLSREELLRVVGQYDVILTDLEHYFDEPLLREARKLRILASASTGLDHLDLQYCRRRNITVLSLACGAAVLERVSATAELTWGLILGLIRKIPAALKSVTEEERWDRERFRTYELQGKTLGIIGYGRLGRMVARYGEAFGMIILVSDPQVKTVPPGMRLLPLEDLLRQSDIISVHVRLQDDTIGFLGPREFALMKPGAWLVNSSRGLLVDEEALLAALESGRLRGAALDVLSGEEKRGPGWLKENKLVRYAQRHDNLLITPHIGGATLDSQRKVNLHMAELIRQCFAAGKGPS
jgi:D-3-phosphoglycerate dehydrogenase